MGLRSFFGGGVDWSLELEQERLLPGRVARGRVTFSPQGRLETRGCVAALIATEQWKYHDTERDANGNTRTVTRTATDEVRRLPVQLMPAGVIDAGQQVSHEFEVPVPPLGPPTFEADVARLTWKLEVKLDMAGGIDPSVEAPVVVLQPTGLLSAGVVNTGQWGLWPEVEGQLGGAPYKLAVEPVPMLLGGAFRGSLELGGGIGGRVREVRLEVKVRAEATVARGLSEDLTLFSQLLPAAGGLAAGRHEFSGTLPEQWLPSVDLPHGRGRARLDIVIDRPLARDDHIEREVALCSTSEM
jgi:hypothetical protein